MPTERQHGGAALALIPMTLPGFMGLNTAQQTGILGPEWATVLLNTVIDDNARVAARRGYDVITTSAAANAFIQLHSHVTHAGSERIIASSSAKFWASSNGGTSWSDITGSISFSTGNWCFANFIDDVYAIKQGNALVKSTSGNFAAVSSSPSGNVVIGAFGRLWATASDGVTLKYSALLNGSDWTGGDTGSIDLQNVWPGTDTITALAAFNGSLVVFGTKNIAIFGDTNGSALGIDPTQMWVTDLITGVGCVARDSVQSIDGDLWFLSKTGVQSLGRVIQERSNPLANLSINVQDQILRYMDAATSLSTLRSVYSPKHKLYLLSFPVVGGTGGAVAFDTRGKLQNGAARCMGIWDLVPDALALTYAGEIVMSIQSATGKIGRYYGGQDNLHPFDMTYESGWLDLTDKSGYLLIAKRLSGTFYTDATSYISFKWGFDFAEAFHTASRDIDGAGTLAEFNVAEFNIGVFGGGVALRNAHTPAAGTGQYVKVGISAPISGQALSVQQLNLMCKTGRMA